MREITPGIVERLVVGEQGTQQHADRSLLRSGLSGWPEPIEQQRKGRQQLREHDLQAAL